MSNVHIQTTQNINIEFKLASVGDRILATLIDFTIFFVYLMVCIFVINRTGLYYSRTAQTLYYLPLMFYSLVCEIFFQGRSFGKMITKIQVVKLNGEQAKFVDYLLRWVFRVVDLFLCFGLVALITIVVNGKGQRVGDLAAATTVIKQKKKTTIHDTILADLSQNHLITFEEVSRLTDHDISIIKEVLEFDQRNSNDAMIHKLVSKTKQTMGVESNMAYRKFLETVVADYSHFHSEK